MIGTMFCQHETPCGWCTRLNSECTEKGDRKPKASKKAVAVPASEEKFLNPVGEYAVKFAQNHGISFSEAMSHPMVKAFAQFQDTFETGLMKEC